MQRQPITDVVNGVAKLNKLDCAPTKVRDYVVVSSSASIQLHFTLQPRYTNKNHNVFTAGGACGNLTVTGVSQAGGNFLVNLDVGSGGGSACIYKEYLLKPGKGPVAIANVAVELISSTSPPPPAECLCASGKQDQERQELQHRGNQQKRKPEEKQPAEATEGGKQLLHSPLAKRPALSAVSPPSSRAKKSEAKTTEKKKKRVERKRESGEASMTFLQGAHEEQAKQQAEERARKETEQQAKKEAKEQAKRRVEKQAKQQAEEQAKQRAEEQAKKETEQQAKEAKEQAKTEGAGARKGGQTKPETCWLCEKCQQNEHLVAGSPPCSYFTAEHGYRFLGENDGIEENGDCFFKCLEIALRQPSGGGSSNGGSRGRQKSGRGESREVVTVESLRKVWAKTMLDEQLQVYQQMAESMNDTWLEPFRCRGDGSGSTSSGDVGGKGRNKGKKEARSSSRRRASLDAADKIHILANPGTHAVTTVEELRRYAEREGKAYGLGECMWADESAIAAVANHLHLAILLIDMGADPGTSPYRRVPAATAATAAACTCASSARANASCTNIEVMPTSYISIRPQPSSSNPHPLVLL
jgi:hypothetical protein